MGVFGRLFEQDYFMILGGGRPNTNKKKPHRLPPLHGFFLRPNLHSRIAALCSWLSFGHKKSRHIRAGFFLLVLSGRQDSNLRPPAPKAGAMTGLRYTPLTYG